MGRYYRTYRGKTDSKASFADDAGHRSGYGRTIIRKTAASRRKKNAFILAAVFVLCIVLIIFQIFIRNDRAILEISVVSYFSGTWSGYGDMIRNGALLARRHLNNRVHIKFIDAASGDAAGIAREVNDSSADTAILFVDSSLGLSIAHNIKTPDKAVILAGSASPEIAALHEGLYIHSISAELQVEALIHLARAEGFSKASIKGSGDKFDDLSVIFKSGWRAHGGIITSDNDISECIFVFFETSDNIYSIPEGQTVLTIQGHGPTRAPSRVITPVGGDKGLLFADSCGKTGVKPLPETALAWDTINLVYNAAVHSGFTARGVQIGLVAAGIFEMATGDVVFDMPGIASKKFHTIAR